MSYIYWLLTPDTEAFIFCFYSCGRHLLVFIFNLLLLLKQRHIQQLLLYIVEQNSLLMHSFVIFLVIPTGFYLHQLGFCSSNAWRSQTRKRWRTVNTVKKGRLWLAFMRVHPARQCSRARFSSRYMTMWLRDRGRAQRHHHHCECVFSLTLALSLSVSPPLSLSL